ncbi:MAG: M48 family metallopeptidase [Burkholderiales bacterium]|nr:M48 family metallopeptidase [Burkholderiales bacterium]
MQLTFDFLAASAPVADPRSRYVQVGGRVVSYRLRRAKRRTIGLVVDRHGLTASAPRWVGLGEIEAFIREKARWVLAKLDEQERRAKPPFAWRVGAALPVLGRPVVLALAPEAPASRLAGDRIEVPLGQDHTVTALRETVLAFLRDHAQALFLERTGLLAARAARAAPPVRVSNARTQWGSCQPDGRIFLSWRLVHLDLHLVDYVVAHELAHLDEMNHSPRFWRAVERLYPDWRAARRELREREHALPEL